MSRPRQTKTIHAALDQAKVFFYLGGPLGDESRTTPSEILLRELGHVLEEHYGMIEIEAVELIRKALRDGTLTARTQRGIVIPPSSWPSKPSRGSGWFWGQIWLNACDGFNGELPSIARECAVEWLYDRTTPSAGRPRFVDAARAAYVKLYPEGHKKAGKGWKEVTAEVAETTGILVSTQTMRRAVNSI